jgi:hypothetical protein
MEEIRPELDAYCVGAVTGCIQLDQDNEVTRIECDYELTGTTSG